MSFRDTWTVKQFEVLMKYSLSYNSERNFGSFEIYDLDSGGNDFYSEGGLWFDDGELVDYNVQGWEGIFDIPIPILDKLEEWGLNVKNMRGVIEE